MLKLVQRPKSPHWQIRGSYKGVRYEESTFTEDKLQAEEILNKFIAGLHDLHVKGPQAVVTFEFAANDYKANGGEARFLEPLKKHFGQTILRTIGQHEIDLAAKKLLPKAGPATRNRQVYTPVSAVLRHASRKKWCDAPNLVRPKVPKRPDRWLKPDEAERLIAACAPHMKPIVTTLLWTGGRAGEVLNLDWKHVDLDRAQVTFVKTKTNQPRSVPLHPRILAALMALKHREGAVFRRPDGKPYSGLKGDGDTSAGTKIGTAFAGACRRAKIANFRVHDCRHTWASWMMQRGVTLASLQMLGGWKTPAMVFKYSHADVSAHAEVISRLPGGNLGELNNAIL